MPKRKVVAIGLLGILVSLLLFIPYYCEDRLSFSQPVKRPSFFIEIPIVEWTYSGVPCIQVEVGDLTWIAMLDLGYTRMMSLTAELLAQISEKVFVKNVSTQGFQGHVYTSQVYQVPSAGMGSLTFSPMVLEEEHRDLQKEAAVIQDQQGFVADGKLGWRLFKESVLFLDMKHNTLAVSDSVRTFEAHRGSLKAFVKIPFSLEKELIEFVITTSRGPLTCFLDSGCTLNHLQMKNPHQLSPQEILADQSKKVKFNNFCIGNRTFGSIEFHPLPISLPVRTQAVLGIDFLLDHEVLIDFKNRYIYFKSQPF